MTRVKVLAQVLRDVYGVEIGTIRSLGLVSREIIEKSMEDRQAVKF
jgi:hypothetical protein